VLNASRHHRKNRKNDLQHPAIADMCSTPRGITGKIARGLVRDRPHDDVLNASRHHRKNRTA